MSAKSIGVKSSCEQSIVRFEASLASLPQPIHSIIARRNKISVSMHRDSRFLHLLFIAIAFDLLVRLAQ